MHAIERDMGHLIWVLISTSTREFSYCLIRDQMQIGRMFFILISNLYKFETFSSITR